MLACNNLDLHSVCDAIFLDWPCIKSSTILILQQVNASGNGSVMWVVAAVSPGRTCYIKGNLFPLATSHATGNCRADGAMSCLHPILCSMPANATAEPEKRVTTKLAYCPKTCTHESERSVQAGVRQSSKSRTCVIVEAQADSSGVPVVRHIQPSTARCITDSISK